MTGQAFAGAWGDAAVAAQTAADNLLSRAANKKVSSGRVLGRDLGID